MLLSWWCPLGPEKDTCRQRQDSLSKWIDWYQSRPISVFIRQDNTKFCIQKPMQAETYQYTLDNVQAGLIYVSCSHSQVNIGEWLRRSANMLDKYRSRDALLQKPFLRMSDWSYCSEYAGTNYSMSKLLPAGCNWKFFFTDSFFLTVQGEESGSSTPNQPTNILPASVLYSLTRSHW